MAPVFTAGATNISATQYQTFNYQPAGATDANGDVITYTAGYWNGSSWIGLPSWISFNASNHTYTGTPPSPGSYTFAMWATDSHGAGVGETFTVNVSAQPQPPQYVGTMNGKLFDFAYPKNVSISIANQFIDPQGAAINYTYSSSTGGIAPSWLYFNASTLTFTGNPNILRDSYLTYGITLTATDANNGLSTSITFTIGYQGKSTGVNSMAMQAQSVQTVQVAQAGVPDLQSFWFTYDADNRTVVNNGALSNGQIVLTGGTYEAPSFANQYDAAGNVVIRNSVNSVAYTPTFTHNVTYNAGDLLSQQMVYDGRNELAQSYYLVDTTIGQSNLGVQTKYWYDADGHQIGNNNYFASNALEPEQGLPDMPNGTMYMPIGGWLEYGAATSYNADGQVTQQVSWGGPTRDWHQLGLIWENGNPMPDEGQTAVPTTASDGQAVMASTTTYTAFDHEDNVTSYSFYQPGVTGGNPAYGANYTVNYIRKDSYLEQSTAGTPTVSGYLPATDTSYYDAFGQRIAVSQTSQNGAGNAQNVTRVFAYNATGEILERRTGTSSGSTFTPNGGNGTDHYVYANGQQIGDMDEAGDINVSGTLTGFSSGNPTQYVVASGDTLESIAQSVYGNSSLAYIIAAANGLTGDNGLVVGQAITVPSVTTNANTSTTFKPYNPGQIIGSTTPSLPAAPPPPPSSHCSGLAEIVVAAVIVVASIYTAGLAAEAMGATASSTWAAGAAAMTGASSAGVGASMAAAAAGGFVGSLAGQAAGDAMGVSHGFSLTAALTSGLASGLTAGIGGAIGGQGDDFSIVANSQGHLEPVGAGLLAGGQYASNSLVSKVTGQASHFSWAGLISTAVTSGITADAGLVSEPLQGLGLSSGSFGGDLAAGILSSGVSRETTKLLGDDHVASWGQTLEDAFGNALGNAAIAGMNSPSTVQQGYQFDFTKGGPGVGGSLPTANITDVTESSAMPLAGTGDYVNYIDTPDDQRAILGQGAVATSDQNASDDQMQRLRDLVPVVNGARTDTTIDHAAWQAAYDAVSYATGEVFNGADDAEASVNAAVEAAGALVHPGNADVSTATQSTFGNYSLATAGTGVGQVDWQGQPLNGPSNFSLGGAYGNVWNSDESFGGKVVDSFRLLGYTVPDAEQRITAERQREAALNAPYATIDAIRESPAFAMGFGAGKIAGQSDEDAARWGAGAQLGATVLTIGGYARALQTRGVGDAPSNEDLPPQQVGSPYFVRIDPVTGSGPMAIDSTSFTSGTQTLNGGIRNARQFWSQWSGAYPETLSDANIARIQMGQSPIVDDAWINEFPEHADYSGETLIHHHLDYGPNAIPLPGSVHSQQPGWGIWHPNHAGQ